MQFFEAKPKTHPCMKQTRKDGAPALKQGQEPRTQKRRMGKSAPHRLTGTPSAAYGAVGDLPEQLPVRFWLRMMAANENVLV
jgi:hypothetical protein